MMFSVEVSYEVAEKLARVVGVDRIPCSIRIVQRRDVDPHRDCIFLEITTIDQPKMVRASRYANHVLSLMFMMIVGFTSWLVLQTNSLCGSILIAGVIFNVVIEFILRKKR